MNIQNVILKPIITEKAMKDAGVQRYTFQVEKAANKYTIKKAIENMFKVNVIDVATRIVKGRTKLVGTRRIKVLESAWKKAIVTIKKDQKIELFEAGASENTKQTNL